MLDAGRFFLRKQQRSEGVSDKEIIRIAIKTMGLDEFTPFKPEERIIEYLLNNPASAKLVNMSLTDFADETASESPAPGGGSISAYVGALGASLAGMVANLSSHKKGWDNQWETFSEWAAKAQGIKNELVKLVDLDTAAFNEIMAAFGLPKNNETEKAARSQAIQTATKYAIEVPFQVMEAAFKSMEVIKAMAEIGNPNSISDAGVAALCATTAVRGALLNVRINAAGYKDKAFTESIIIQGTALETKAKELETEIIKIVEGKIEG
jgi:glutamate formiminotransferase/formiminotetrahydrofolate cyclodeaminase